MHEIYEFARYLYTFAGGAVPLVSNTAQVLFDKMKKNYYNGQIPFRMSKST